MIYLLTLRHGRGEGGCYHENFPFIPSLVTVWSWVGASFDIQTFSVDSLAARGNVPHYFLPGYFFVPGHPEDYVPNFGAHKVELAPNSGFRKKYDVVDSSGDAVVIQITNNEEFPIHVCLISYQSDGSIVALYPAAKKASYFFSLFYNWASYIAFTGEGFFTSSRLTFLSLPYSSTL